MKMHASFNGLSTIAIPKLLWTRSDKLARGCEDITRCLRLCRRLDSECELLSEMECTQCPQRATLNSPPTIG